MDDFVRRDTSSMYIFQKSEIPGLFKQCKRDVRKRRFNEVILTINKVLHSNADEQVKQRFLFLRDFLPEPRNWKDIRTHVRVSELFNLPTLYQGVYLVIDGPISGLQIRTERTAFSLRARDRSGGDEYTFLVRMDGRYDKLKNGAGCRVLARFDNIVPLKGSVMVEGLKAWIEQKEFYEVVARSSQD
jgi:hypothetical protein